MKKKILIIVSIVVVIALGVVLYNSLFNTPYTEIIESIWNIDLPEAGAKEIYSYSEPSFHGDGIRYHVIDYPIGNETKRIEDTKFQLEKLFPASVTTPTEKQIEDVVLILEQTQEEIPKDTIPEFEKCQLIYKEKDDGSELYLFYWYGTGTVYVIENIF